MGFSLGAFLLPIFQGLISTAVFESGKAGASFLTDKKSMEMRYKNAFEKAVCRFYADPEYAGNEARRNYDHYLKALKNDFKKEEDFKPEKGQYKQLLEFFEEEVCKDKRLWFWSIFKMLRTSVTVIEEIKLGQQKIIEELISVRKDNQSGLSDISGKLDTLIKSVNNLPTLQQIVIIPSQLVVAGIADAEQIHIAPRTELVDRCVDISNSGKVLVLYGGVKIGKRTLAELVISKLADGFICRNVSAADLENVIRICQQEIKEGRHPVITTQAPLDLNISLVDTTCLEQVEVPLLSEKETKELIATYSPREDLGKFIYAHSYGHPVLVRTLCAYLVSCNWVINEDVFGKMLNFSFDHQLSRSLADLMQKMIPDAENRSLLNRIMLFKNYFKEDDVIALASIEPAISEPRTRLLTLLSGWITEKDGTYKVTPLYDKAWNPDMNHDCYKACNWMLASRVLIKSGPLNELDVLHYILYAQNAEKYDEAGLMYMRALEKIKDEDLPKLTILPSMWVDVPLPRQMTESLRVAIRVQQITKIKNLTSGKRNYILNDLCRIIEGAEESELTSAYYSVLSALCWAENRMQAGLHYHNLSITKRNKDSKGVDELDEMEDLYKQSVWFLPLRFTKLEEFDAWFDSFTARPFEYDHSDPQICENCYMAAYQFVNKICKDKGTDDIISGLRHMLDKAIVSRCPEMAAAVLFEMMETFNKAKQYENTRKVYSDYYNQYAQYPLAIVLLNGSMAYSIYSNSEADNDEALSYIDAMQTSTYGEVVPNIHLHLGQVKSYVLSETDVNTGIAQLKEVINYVQKPGHASTLYEYYQCLGELSLMYWEVGDRNRSVEVVSECVKYVTSEEGLKSPFAKTYLCLCDCLLVNYLDKLKVRELPEGQARPYRGMFTEQDVQSLDSIYTEDRIFTSSYLMYQISEALKLEKLETKWAYKVLDAIKSRGESQEIHFIATLLVPVFLKEQDFDAVAQIAEISSVSQAKTFEKHPEMKRENADSEFVEYVITPGLFLALSMAITDDKSGLEKICNILKGYQPVISNEVVKRVVAVLERGEYNSAYIKEVHQLEMNKNYPVYIFAYLITTLYVDSYEAFKLIMAVIVRLESDLVKVIGSEVKAVINDFIASFWRARIMTSPEDFVNYEFLASKGMKVIDEYEGKDNQANHTMFVVRHHLPYKVNLNVEQETWLDE